MEEMKNMWESKESFTAYATIDYCYWRLGELQKAMNKPTDAISQMVDKATGFDKKRDKDIYEEIKDLCESIIENKKIINADYADTEMMLNATVEMLEKL